MVPSRTEITVDIVTRPVSITTSEEHQETLVLAAEAALDEQREARNVCTIGQLVCAMEVHALSHNGSVVVQSVCRGCRRPEHVQQATLNTVSAIRTALHTREEQTRKLRCWERFVVPVVADNGINHEVIGCESFELCADALSEGTPPTSRSRYAVKAFSLLCAAINRPANKRLPGLRSYDMQADNPYRHIQVISSRAIKEQTASQMQLFLPVSPDTMRMLADKDYLRSITGVGRKTLELYEYVYRHLCSLGYGETATPEPPAE